MKLAVIPARGGSKRIPRKNVKPFGGCPMISWSIRATFDSGVFDRVIVSTDDDEITNVARDYGADVPFRRPAELSGDYIGTSPVVAHAISWQSSNGEKPEAVCCIYPTAPFLRSEDLKRGLDRLYDTECDFAFSVTSYPFPVQRALRIRDDQRLEMLDASQFSKRSQDLEEVFHDAGQFYWGRPEAWLSGRPLFGPHASPVILPRWRVQDIDTAEDWERAEFMFRANALKLSNAVPY